MNKYLRQALNHAINHDYDHNLDYKLCAMLVKGGNIISVGFNQRKTNGFVEHYTDKVRGCNRDFSLSTHAEMHCVLQSRGKTDLNGSKIYVVRLRPANSDGTLGMARPCPICQNVLIQYGIKRAYYSIDDNNYGIMKVCPQEITDVQVVAYKTEQI